MSSPLAIGAAVCVCFFAPSPLPRFFDAMMGVLAGVPSVVIGLWGITFLVPAISKYQAPGTSLLAGIVILAIMILPSVYLASVAGFRAIPAHLLVSRQALGISRSAFVWHVAFPITLSSMGYGVILGVGRAIGEAMALIMVSGNIPSIPHSLFDPIRTLAANMALEIAYATGMHRSALYVSSLLLLITTSGLAIATYRHNFRNECYG